MPFERFPQRPQPAPALPEPLLLPPRETARLLGVSERHLRDMDAERRVPRPIYLGRLKRWSAAELRAWLAAGGPTREAWEAMRAGTQCSGGEQTARV